MSIKPPPPNEDQIKQIIDKGGKVSKEESYSEWTMISLRIPKKMIKDIDELRNNRPGLSRSAWLLEALCEKLKREK